MFAGKFRIFLDSDDQIAPAIGKTYEFINFFVNLFFFNHDLTDLDFVDFFANEIIQKMALSLAGLNNNLRLSKSLDDQEIEGDEKL